MIELDLTKYHELLVITRSATKSLIFDPVRKKDFVLQPEELVRQSWIQYLHLEWGIAYGSLAVEKQLAGTDTKRRYDLVYYKKGEPQVLFEFKSFQTKISDQTSLQIADYNRRLRVPYLVLSNGRQHYAAFVDFVTNKVTTLAELPFDK